ncbi:MAG: LysR family transcriptional regulator [Chromatiales bacterium]|nr:LysR family transcriptional regulator [Chromatiales bacterium]
MNAPAPLGPRRDRLKQLRAFCEATRLGSLSAAARVMASSQPALSNHVRALEEDLGTALFRRVGGGIVPTRVGRNLYRAALPLVEGLLRLPELFEERHFGVGTDTLRIGAGHASAAYLLPDIVRRYLVRHPRVRIEVWTGTGAERLRWLRQFELDAIVGAFGTAPADVVFHPLVTADAVLVVPEHHPLSEVESVGFDALVPYPMVALVSEDRLRRFQDAVFQLHGVRPHVVLEVDGWGAVLNHVAAGVGIALVPDLCVGAHERVRVVRVRHSFNLRTYGVAVRRDALMGLVTRQLLDMVLPAATDEKAAR